MCRFRREALSPIWRFRVDFQRRHSCAKKGKAARIHRDEGEGGRGREREKVTAKEKRQKSRL